ncbi:MAG: branched-chain amino acid ABC transporter permease [Caldilineae bacterium]|nr:MAG: branched-chain amino acid ABC transporter permease [Caldilineae bacterium]
MTPDPPASTSRARFLAGVRRELPLALGVTPFGLIYGVLALAAGLPPWLAVAMSSIVFAGSAQFIGVQLIGAGAPPAIVILTTFIVNLRHALYGFSLSPYLRALPDRWYALLAYLLTDEAYAVTIIDYRREADAIHRRWFLLGAGLTLWTVWQVSTVVGVLVGAQLPPGWALDFTLALTFIGLVVPTLRDRPNIAAAISAGIIAVLAHGLPYQLGLVAASLVGILVGTWLERRV